MPSSYTNNLQLEKQAYGENGETWGFRDNTTFDKIDLAVSGWTIVQLSAATSPVTLTRLIGAVDQAGSAAVEFQGATAGDFTIIVPAAQGLRWVRNSTPNNIILSMTPTGGSTATFTIPINTMTGVWSDGLTLQSFINAVDGPLTVSGNLSVGGSAALGSPLPVTSGGTGGASQNLASINITRVGQVTWWPAKSAIPTGWLSCNGAAISRTTFNALFLEIGTTYGAGDGSTTFNLPPFNTVSGQSPSPVFWSSDTSINPGSTVFINAGTTRTTELGAIASVPYACTIKNLNVRTNIAPGTGQSVVITLRSNLADTVLTATVANASLNATDLVHSVSLATGTAICFKMVTSAGCPAIVANISFEIDTTSNPTGLNSGAGCWVIKT